MRTDFLCITVFRVASGLRVKLTVYKSALKPTVVYSTNSSKAVVPVLVLLFVAFVVYVARQLVLCLILFYFVLVFFSPFSIAITSLGEKRANLRAFRTFVRFALVWFYLFPLPPLPLGVWEELRLTFFVIVAHPRLFSYLYKMFYILLKIRFVCNLLS